MLRSLADDLLSSLLPGRCPGCGRRAEPVCERCARSMRAAPAGRPIAGVTSTVSVFAYEGVARELVARVKYRNERVAVRWLAARLAQSCAGSPALCSRVQSVPRSVLLPNACSPATTVRHKPVARWRIGARVRHCTARDRLPAERFSWSTTS
jgi:hypothetical protein